MTQTLSAEVAANVRALLARDRIPQSQIAEALGLSQAAVSRRLAGTLPFQLDELEAISALLNVPIESLVRAA